VAGLERKGVDEPEAAHGEGFERSAQQRARDAAPALRGSNDETYDRSRFEGRAWQRRRRAAEARKAVRQLVAWVRSHPADDLAALLGPQARDDDSGRQAHRVGLRRSGFSKTCSSATMPGCGGLTSPVSR